MRLMRPARAACSLAWRQTDFFRTGEALKRTVRPALTLIAANIMFPANQLNQEA